MGKLVDSPKLLCSPDGDLSLIFSSQNPHPSQPLSFNLQRVAISLRNG